MKSYIFIIWIFILNYNQQLFSQIIIDQVTRKGISHVNVVSNTIEYVFSTDLDGDITELDKEKLRNCESFYTSHICYEEKYITLKELLENDTIILVPKFHMLDEIVIKETPIKYNYQKFNTLIRSGQFNEGYMKYYIEGELNYFVKSKQTKFNDDFEFCQFRVFENFDIPKLNNKKGNILFTAASIPNLSHEKVLNYLLDSSKIQLNKIDENLYNIIIDKNIRGTLTNGNYIVINLDDATLLGSKGLFDLKSNLISKRVTLIFSKIQNNSIQLDISTIKYMKIHYSYFVTSKKQGCYD